MPYYRKMLTLCDEVARNIEAAKHDPRPWMATAVLRDAKRAAIELHEAIVIAEAETNNARKGEPDHAV